jgi:hypothetical protein
VRDGCGGVPARNPSGENTRAVNTHIDPRFAHRNHQNRHAWDDVTTSGTEAQIATSRPACSHPNGRCPLPFP